jgi:hypothetical protein
MAFADPQTVTFNAVPYTLNHVSSSPNTGEYLNTSGDVKLTIAHAYGKRIRRTIRIDRSKLAADALNPTINSPYSMSTYLVVDQPIMGYTLAELQNTVDGFVNYLQASTGARVLELLGGEN